MSGHTSGCAAQRTSGFAPCDCGYPERALGTENYHLRVRLVELTQMLRECADGLADEIEARYAGVKDHPAMACRYERDMDTVVRARAVLNDQRGTT